VSPDGALPIVPATMRRHDFAAMGTTVSVATEAAATGAGDEVERLFAEWELRLSRFRPDSELSRLNARAGQPVAVSPPLFEVLSAALRAARATAGLYDPTLLRTLEGLGYDRSFELLPRGASEAPPSGSGPARPAPAPSASIVAPAPTAPSAAPPHATLSAAPAPTAQSAAPVHAAPSAAPASAAPAHTAPAHAAAVAAAAGGGWRRIELDPRTRTVTIPAGVGVDLGGIAKGMAVDAAIERLRGSGVRAAMVSAGGDLRVHGLSEGLASWPIAVDGGHGPVTVALTHGSLATSGIAKRRWRQGAVERHHLVDPRDGRPSSSGLWSVTVAAAICGQAEVAAKTAFILGPRAAIEFLERKGLAGLLVGRSGASWRCGSWPAVTEPREEAACSPASR
jgi:FAD:protein FMN transferase